MSCCPLLLTSPSLSLCTCFLWSRQGGLTVSAPRGPFQCPQFAIWPQGFSLGSRYVTVIPEFLSDSGSSRITESWNFVLIISSLLSQPLGRWPHQNGGKWKKPVPWRGHVFSPFVDILTAWQSRTQSQHLRLRATLWRRRWGGSRC